jgi:malonyl-CoA/methylmalonyl-CoA synthetase
MADAPDLPRQLLPARVAAHGSRLAIVDPDGEHRCDQVHQDALRVANRLCAGRTSLAGDRVGILCRPGRDFVVALLGTWLAGGVAVPLHPDHPGPELTYYLEDAGAGVVLYSGAFDAAARSLVETVAGLERVDVADVGEAMPSERPDPAADQPALMVYTSGTTGRPKGAVHTHGGLAAQIVNMVDAWRWSEDDRVLLVLPLHHVHGLVNVTMCALWCGAVCEAPGGFDAVAVWERLASGDLTVLMAVPTIYARLIAAWDAAEADTRQRWSHGARQLRLMVSGSAALPVATLDRWEQITGHRLLERYGMTELGMVLTNDFEHRVPGHVGRPFPGLEVRLVDEGGHDVGPGVQGELLVRGPQIFTGYWNRPDVTADAFVDGWFRTGDVAIDTPEGFRLLGRASVDIIKTGGEKVSALEIEEVFRTHPSVGDCAVVGLPDPEWGQCVGILVVPSGTDPNPEPTELRSWGKQRLAVAKVPTRWLFADELPRNALGKVTKAEVTELFVTR